MEPAEVPTMSAYPPLRIGEHVPDFSARTTQGFVRLSDYRGRWLVFFSHPADFTPVCTSEFIELAKAEKHFAELDCALLGHSADSLFSHLAWLRAIRDDFGVTVPFPIVEDPTLEIARAFGMLGAGERHAATVRAVYFIDPHGILQAQITYPLEVGRSVEEMLRLVAALRRTESKAVMTPADWKPGEPALLPPEFTDDAVLRSNSASAWFYRKEGEA